MMYGILYGVGVGPGDPELLTLKAIKTISDCDMIAVPGSEKKSTIAYQIVEQVIVDLDNKECLKLEMPMTKDPQILEESHKKAGDAVIAKLKEGKNVAFLTLGDPTIYSTYLYIHRYVKEKGFPTIIINGIPSFCAASARMNIGLVEKAEMLHVIPASYQIEDALKMPGTKVLMKAGAQLRRVKETIWNMAGEAVMIENCGMSDGHIYEKREQIPDSAGYYSLLIVKE